MEKRCALKNVFGVYALHISAYIGRQTQISIIVSICWIVCGVLSVFSLSLATLKKKRKCYVRGEQSSKNRKLTHVCWTKWKYFSVVCLMESVCFRFHGWNVFVCSTTVCFHMKKNQNERIEQPTQKMKNEKWFLDIAHSLALS